MRERRPDHIPVALVIPLQGPAGIFGPSLRGLCRARRRGGQPRGRRARAPGQVRGRRRRCRPTAGRRRGRRPGDLRGGRGRHRLAHLGGAPGDRPQGDRPGAVRLHALYEGGERTPGVFLAGETPSQQLLPSMRWMAEELGVHRWCIVGDDYVWPRGSAAVARRYARISGAEICDEVFVGLGIEQYGEVLGRVERSRAEAVLMLLVGDDAVQFNRAFARAGLDQQVLRLSTLMEENMLLASGADSTSGLFASAGFFDSLATSDSLDFIGRFSARYGPEAPVLNSLGESCYEGLRLLVQLVRSAGSLDLDRICAVADTVGYDGPRGAVQLRGRHLEQRVYLARADRMDFEVLDQLTPTRG